MKKAIFTLLVLLTCSTDCIAQCVLFTWDQNCPGALCQTDELDATIGTDGTGAACGSACTLRPAPMAPGSGGTPQGLAVGPARPFGTCGCLSVAGCGCDINLVVPTGSCFNAPEIEYSIDYRHTSGPAELVGWFFERGTFRVGFESEKFIVYFDWSDGGSGCFSSNFTAFPPSWASGVIPADAVWRNYKFSYDQTLGKAYLIIDNGWYTQTFNTVPGRALCWTGTPTTMTIGSALDNMKRVESVLDNARVGPPIPLPVVLKSFSGNFQDNTIVLAWETTKEVNNDHFEVWRSADGQDNWEVIGKIDGQNTTNDSHTYSYTDMEPMLGSNFYMLMQFDVDGKTTGSSVIEVVPFYSGARILSLHPNPVTNDQSSITCTFRSDEPSTLQYDVVDILGRQVRTGSFDFAGGTGSLVIPTDGLSNGTYLLNLKDKQYTHFQKFIILE